MTSAAAAITGSESADSFERSASAKHTTPIQYGTAPSRSSQRTDASMKHVASRSKRAAIQYTAS